MTKKCWQQNYKFQEFPADRNVLPSPSLIVGIMMIMMMRIDMISPPMFASRCIRVRSTPRLKRMYLKRFSAEARLLSDFVFSVDLIPGEQRLALCCLLSRHGARNQGLHPILSFALPPLVHYFLLLPLIDFFNAASHSRAQA